MLRELNKQEVQLRELNDIEMEMVSGGEGTVDEVATTAQIQSDNSNPFAGMTGEQILSMFNLNTTFEEFSNVAAMNVVYTGGSLVPNDDDGEDLEAFEDALEEGIYDTYGDNYGVESFRSEDGTIYFFAAPLIG